MARRVCSIVGTRLGGVGGGVLSDHLKIDLALIRATGDGLGRIKDVLERADASKLGADVLDSGGIVEAMDEFVDNWKIHRGKLVSSVEAHQKMAIESADAYQHTDTELTKELTKPPPPNGERKAS